MMEDSLPISPNAQHNLTFGQSGLRLLFWWFIFFLHDFFHPIFSHRTFFSSPVVKIFKNSFDFVTFQLRFAYAKSIHQIYHCYFMRLPHIEVHVVAPRFGIFGHSQYFYFAQCILWVCVRGKVKTEEI